MTCFIRVYPQDTKQSPDILHFVDVSGRLAVRPRYQDMACPKCHKLDERKALSRGVDGDVVISSQRDFLGTTDGICIVSQRLRSVLDTIPDAVVDYFPLPSNASHFAAMPKSVYEPKANDPAFRVFGECPTCHRYREVVRGNQQPTIADMTSIGMIRYESRSGIRSGWYISREIANVLMATEPKLKGLYFDPNLIGT